MGEMEGGVGEGWGGVGGDHTQGKGQGRTSGKGLGMMGSLPGERRCSKCERRCRNNANTGHVGRHRTQHGGKAEGERSRWCRSLLHPRLLWGQLRREVGDGWAGVTGGRGGCVEHDQFDEGHSEEGEEDQGHLEEGGDE